jgi:peroxiredoxin Q/BCP
MFTEGDRAPDFELSDHRGEPVRLSDYRGQRVVLYFYPKADTPGCTKEACSFRDAYDDLEEQGVTVLGVSTDSVDELEAFADKYDLPFQLLSDPDGEVARAYESLASESPVAERNTFVIDEEGQIASVYEGVSPEGHAEKILQDGAATAG